MKKYTLAVLLIVAMACPAGAITLTFDELPSQPLPVSYMGVNFSGDATYNWLFWGNHTYVQQATLGGIAGAGVPGVNLITLDFDLPTPILSFGMAMTWTDRYFSVELFDVGLTSLGVQVITLDPAQPDTFYTYSGAPIKRAIIDVGYVAAAQIFGMDNLTFNPAPLPSALLLLSSGLIGLLVWRRSGG